MLARGEGKHMSGFPFSRRTTVIREPGQSVTVQGFSIDLDDAAITGSRGARAISSGHRVPNPWTRSALQNWPRPPVPVASTIARSMTSVSVQVIEEDPDLSLEMAACGLGKRRRRAGVWLMAVTTIIAIGLAYYGSNADSSVPYSFFTALWERS